MAFLNSWKRERVTSFLSLLQIIKWHMAAVANSLEW